MNNFADRLLARITEMNNPTVMGLDPMIDYIPEFIKAKHLKECDNVRIATGNAIREFNFRLIDAVKGIIPAVKPQFAFYEMFGIEGISALHDTIDYAKKTGMIVIADAKRNDIGSTATAYAKSILGATEFLDKSISPVFDADAITVNCYLGIDGILPFIKECEDGGKGIFILVRTSNPSAVDFQDILTENGKPFYQVVAQKVKDWGRTVIGESGYSSIGAVVGATWPQQAAELRIVMNDSIILVPGYGAQGGSADAAAANFNTDGKGAIVNASRSLMCAYKKDGFMPEQFEEATYKEAIRMKNDLCDAISKKKGN
ncbi:MAG: orotidine-5'-phosphate decarboxylase [Saccharofermentanales bacterium]